MEGPSGDRPRKDGPIICVVTGCSTDVSGGPHYLRRHKICQFHLKAKVVELDGKEVRFCQQCGRFQPLADFKEDRRSCESALAAHNARRRVKKDLGNGTGTKAARSKASKRVLSALLDDRSSSEDGAIGVSRKSAAPRKSSSQRSGGGQQHSGGSDSFKGGGNSDEGERPLSDGAQGGWLAGNASPNNSYDSPITLEQQLQQVQLQYQLMCGGGNSNSASPAAMGEGEQQLQQQLHMLQAHMLPDGSCFGSGHHHQHMMQQDNSGLDGLLRSAAGAGHSMSRMSTAACCAGAHTGAALLQQQVGQAQHMSMHSAGMAAVSQAAEQCMLDPNSSCGAGCVGGAGCFCGPTAQAAADSLEAWMVPHGIMQQQAAQLQQFWGPVGTAGGLQEAMGQSLMLQQAVKEHQQHHMLLMQSQQPPPMQQQQPSLLQQEQHLSGLLSGLMSTSTKASGGDSSQATTGTNMSQEGSAATAAAVDTPGATAAAASGLGPSACGPLMPATSAAAAAALASHPMLEMMPVKGANSSSSLSLLDAVNASAACKRCPADVAAGGACELSVAEEVDLLDQTLEVLLASNSDWQMDDVLMVPPTRSLRSGAHTNSGMAPVATTSSPSSSNINGGNASGPLSVPSLPSATASIGGSGLSILAGQPGAACGMSAVAAGLSLAADALQVGSPGKGAGSMLHAAGGGGMQGSMLAAGGGGGGHAAATTAGMDDLLHSMGGIGSLPAATGGMGLSVALNAGGSGMGALAGSCGAAANCQMPAAAAAGTYMALGGPAVSTGPSVFQGTFASMGHGIAGLLGGVAPATAAMLQPVGLRLGSTQGMLQYDAGLPSMPGPLVQQSLWHQQQQQTDTMLLHQQLLMQQQQEAEVLLQQQQQQLQRRQQLMQLQANLNARMTNTQQLVRLSIKLHGVTPDQLPSSTVLAMERLLLNNPHDIETILLQPSLRQGCIQFEFDVLVKCAAVQQQEAVEGLASAHASATAGSGAAGLGAGVSGFELFEEQEEEEGSEGPKPRPLSGRTSNIAAIVAALDCNAATQAAEQKLRLALPFAKLVSVLLDLPLRQQASGGGAAACPTVGKQATAIYAQVGDCMGAWRADSGFLQDWAPQLPQQRSADVVGADNATSCSTSSRGWRPSIRACMPIVIAAPESSANSSPTAAAAAGHARVLKPLPLKVQLQAAPGSSSKASGPMQLWCTRRGLFLPVAIRPTPDAATAAGMEPAAGAQQQQQDLQVVAALLDSTPGLLLLQAEQPVLLSAGHASGSDDARPASEADQAGCMSSLVPVVLCPSAAMAAEVKAHLLVTDAHGQSAQKLLHLGLVRDFWAMWQQHQQEQQEHVAPGPRSVWQQNLLHNRKYQHAIKAMGTHLMLYTVISGMTATSSHLHSIMAALRALQASTPADDAGAAAAAQQQHAGAAEHAAAAEEVAPRTSGEGTSAAAAAGVKPVQEWVFEDVDCKAGRRGSDSGASSVSMGGDDDSAAAAGAMHKSLHKLSQHGPRPESPVARGMVPAMEQDGQQSPLTIFKGAAQMMALLLVMYLLIQVVAAVYKGHSPAKQLLASLLQLKELMGVMLVPLAMMCLGGVLAVWQFGLTGAAPALHLQQQRQRDGAVFRPGLGAADADAASSKGALAAAAGAAAVDALD